VLRRTALLLVLTSIVAILTAPPGAGARTEPPPNAVSSLTGPQYVEGGALPGAGDSYRPERFGTESVINEDDRGRILATSAYPNSASGARGSWSTPTRC
jgi:hypothetical protein